MEHYIALLRGINLGDRNKIPMPALKAAVENEGFLHVQTYLHTGNILFESHIVKPEELVRRIQTLIKKEFSFEIITLIRRVKELKKISTDNPLLKSDTDLGTLYVTFLDEEPPPETLAAIPLNYSEEDVWTVKGKQIYLSCPNGYGKTKLNNSFFERKLAVNATTRNWKTVTALNKLAHSDSAL